MRYLLTLALVVGILLTTACPPEVPGEPVIEQIPIVAEAPPEEAPPEAPPEEELPQEAPLEEAPPEEVQIFALAVRVLPVDGAQQVHNQPPPLIYAEEGSEMLIKVICWRDVHPDILQETGADAIIWPRIGREFSHWSQDASGHEHAIVVTMDSDKLVIAHFVFTEHLPITLTLTVVGQGSVSIWDSSRGFPFRSYNGDPLVPKVITTHQFPEGGVRLRLRPYPCNHGHGHWEFSHWVWDILDEDITISTHHASVWLHGDKAIEAHFVDQVPPSVHSVRSEELGRKGPGELAIDWAIDEFVKIKIEYGKTQEYGSYLVFDEEYRERFWVVFTGLEPGTDYNVRVWMKDTSGNEAWSENVVFTTSE